MKYFIITIDTEGDNLWNWKDGDAIYTENAKYLERFQKLCNSFGFKPVWLSNWEMINSSIFVEFAKKELIKNNCEIGMHIHAWNNPPLYQLSNINIHNAPYLIEYPPDIMEKKIESYLDRFIEVFGTKPFSHRAGRWAMNDYYFKLLSKFGIVADCSYTPGVNWKKSYGQTEGFCGPDYRKVSTKIDMIDGVLEIPVTIRKRHYLEKEKHKSIVDLFFDYWGYIKGRNVWLRPNGMNYNQMVEMVNDIYYKSDSDYIMFMLHSSELMEGCNPTFKTKKSIEDLYCQLEQLFDCISKKFISNTLQEYCINSGYINKLS